MLDNQTTHVPTAYVAELKLDFSRARVRGRGGGGGGLCRHCMHVLNFWHTYDNPDPSQGQDNWKRFYLDLLIRFDVFLTSWLLLEPRE